MPIMDFALLQTDRRISFITSSIPVIALISLVPSPHNNAHTQYPISFGFYLKLTCEKEVLGFEENPKKESLRYKTESSRGKSYIKNRATLSKSKAGENRE
jgi:hypothetical protein